MVGGVQAVWKADTINPWILFSIFGTYLYLIFETIPESTYAVEISTATFKPSYGAHWTVTNIEDKSATIFPADAPTLTVAFKAKTSGLTHLVLNYELSSVPAPPPYNDDPCFYGCKLRLIP